MTEHSWSTCNRCNTQEHTTLEHPGLQDPVPLPMAQQPAPFAGSHRDVLPLVMADYEARIRYYADPERYGQPLRIDNLRNHLRDAYEEGLDQVGYLKAGLILWEEMCQAMRKIYVLTHYGAVPSHDLLSRLDAIAILAAPYAGAAGAEPDVPAI